MLPYIAWIPADDEMLMMQRSPSRPIIWLATARPT